MTFKNMASIGMALAILSATFSPSLAGESRFQSTWTPDARADLVKMVHMHQWNDEVINKSLDRFFTTSPCTQTPHLESVDGLPCRSLA